MLSACRIDSVLKSLLLMSVKQVSDLSFHQVDLNYKFNQKKIAARERLFFFQGVFGEQAICQYSTQGLP